MKVVLCGANGAMGKLIDGILGAECVGRVSIDGENGVPKTFGELGKVEADVVIDFSHHTAIADVLAYTKSIGAAVVVGTTGHTAEEKAMIDAAAKEIPVFFTGNVSLGIAVLCRLAKEAAAYFPDADIEIVETHHTRKVDAPSGTHALRLGNVVGIHEVHIHTGNQSLTLKHESGSRAMLADGAVTAARFMVGKAAGMYNMENILG